MLKNSLKWAADLARQINDDYKTFEVRMTELFDIVYLNRYYRFNCKQCGRNSNEELCDSCDY